MNCKRVEHNGGEGCEGVQDEIDDMRDFHAVLKKKNTLSVGIEKFMVNYLMRRFRAYERDTL